jgi:hypothetical protein
MSIQLQIRHNFILTQTLALGHPSVDFLNWMSPNLMVTTPNNGNPIAKAILTCIQLSLVVELRLQQCISRGLLHAGSSL